MPRYLFPALINTRSARAPDIPNTGSPADWYRTPLEKNFPHILTKIQTLWGYPELNRYFLRLTIDDRGDREGFPTDVWDDLQMLMRLHQDLFPNP